MNKFVHGDLLQLKTHFVAPRNMQFAKTQQHGLLELGPPPYRYIEEHENSPNFIGVQRNTADKSSSWGWFYGRFEYYKEDTNLKNQRFKQK